MTVTKTSKDAYHATTKKRVTIRGLVFDHLFANQDYAFTAREVYQWTMAGTLNSVKSRLSELVAEGVVKISGTKPERGHMVQTYQYDPTGTASKKISWKEAYEQAVTDYYNMPYDIDNSLSWIKSRAATIKGGVNG